MTSIEQAYRRFARERFPLPSEEQIAALERRLGVKLPADYREFILNYNGGYFTDPEVIPRDPSCATVCLAGMRGIGATVPAGELAHPSDLVVFDDNDPPQVLPIGSTPMGDLILLVTRMDETRGNILLKLAYGDFYFLADGIEEFFGLLRDSLQG
jgi:hypothetical protein